MENGAKMNKRFLGFFLTMLCSGLLLLHAEEPSPAAASLQNVSASTSEESTAGIDNAVQLAQQEVRDPFAVAPEAETPLAPGMVGPEIAVTLQGMGFGSKEAYAVIGGEVVYEGDEKKGIKLLEVRRHEVDILLNGGKVTIPLFPDQDLKKAKDRAKKKGAMGNASVDQSSETPSSLSGREQAPL